MQAREENNERERWGGHSDGDVTAFVRGLDPSHPKPGVRAHPLRAATRFLATMLAMLARHRRIVLGIHVALSGCIVLEGGDEAAGSDDSGAQAPPETGTPLDSAETGTHVDESGGLGEASSTSGRGDDATSRGSSAGTSRGGEEAGEDEDGTSAGSTGGTSRGSTSRTSEAEATSDGGSVGESSRGGTSASESSGDGTVGTSHGSSETTIGTSSTDTGGSGPSASCEDVRLTRYTASARTGCGYRRDHAFMPAFVRERGLTMAMAEPFYGGSYGCAPGESCGECYEITTAFATEIVMSDNLCPIDGNPLCSEPDRLHFDLSMEAAEALSGGRNDFAVARPVPCPVTGSIHIEVRDRSRGYYQFGVLNHRIPVRRVEVQVADSSAWIEAERVWGGVWAVQHAAFDLQTGGEGGRLRLTSAQGEVVTSTARLGSEDEGDTTDLGVQFTDQAPDAGGTCEP